MPYIHLRLGGTTLRPEQRQALAAQITDLVVDLLGKRRSVTALTIEQSPAGQWWYVDGRPVPEGMHPAHLEVRITDGSSTRAEIGAFVHAAKLAMSRVLGCMPEASYVVVDEVRADAWGYDGQTQAARRRAAASASGERWGWVRRLGGVAG